MLRVELLPAGYGDAILLGYGPESDAKHHLLIDAGQACTVAALQARLAELRRARGRIDLLIVTHIDNDHIGGVLKLLADPETAGMIDAIWFNGYVHLLHGSGLLGPIQGEKLTKRIVDLGLGWNWTWPHKVDTTKRVGGAVVVSKPTRKKLPGGATAIVLSPSKAKLAKLVPVWDEVVSRAGLRPDVAAVEDEPLVAPGLLGGALDDWADVSTPIDTAEANGSSIAFVFEYAGKRVLFGADAHPDLLVDMLVKLGPAPYRVEACKLPHHGSKHNVTRQLVQALDCPLWLLSSNGVRFKHPDDIALARVVKYGVRNGRCPTFGWNYESERFRAFTGMFLPVQCGYKLKLPSAGGLTLDL